MSDILTTHAPAGVASPPASAPPLRRRLSTLEFSRRYIKFDGKEIDPAAQWPWIIEPMEYMDRVRGATFLIKACIQSMKSGLAELVNARRIALQPTRAIWYFPSDQAGKDFSEDKWNPLVDNCTPIQRILYENPHKRTKLAIDLPFGHFRMCSAGTTMNRNSKSACDITCDEAWEYEPGWLTDIEGRLTSYLGQHSLIIPTSGEDLGSEVNEKWVESDQRTWHHRCPHCSADFIPDFRFPHELDRPGGLRFDHSENVFHADGSIDTAALAATVRLQCSACRTEFPYSPALQARLNSHAHGARYLPLNPKPKPRTHAWNWNALVNMAWDTLAELQLKAELALSRGDETKLEVFVRKRAARAYDIREYVRVSSLDAAKGDYPLSPTPHAAAHFHTLTIDVQQDHYWYLVRAWFSDTTSRLVAYGKALSTTELRDIQHRYGIKDHGGDIRFDEKTGQIVMAPCQVYLDGNYNPSQVRRLAAAYGWVVLRGEDCREFRHKDGFYRLYSETIAVDAYEGTVNTARYVAEIKFANNAARNRLALLRSITEPRRLWTFAADATETYTDHLNSWVRIEKRAPKTGALVYEWRQVADRDDLFWCEKAAVVVASMAGLIGTSDPEQKPEETKSTSSNTALRNLPSHATSTIAEI